MQCFGRVLVRREIGSDRRRHPLRLRIDEQRSGGDIDRRADIYACGVVMYELLTGERPAGTEVPSDLNNKVPKWLDDDQKP